ncbi:protein FAR-RED IMPAIRED RESPONSE 1-like [Hevea brasiliensis]|uniref:protein FAR-RED IMPAIRED RESPONSE 1-like n=1 Tax=Hevea brasiliensis TaxID=3981 RepID=UPI0025D80AAA|nr:protein FAR-RED IMPAIRED RESPONSE 1-like [Hevea brasiliensis]
MAGLSQGRSYRRQLFDEIFDFSEDDSLFAEDVEEDESAGDQDMNKGGIRAVANTNAIEEGPLTGMLFPCISTMFNFYKEHARLKGFSVFKRSAVNVRGGSRKYQTISCDKGRKAIGAKSSKRINCPAKINAILRENGMWQISKVISSHNHELEPSMSRLMVAHRSLNMDMKRRLEANDIAGIRPAKSIRLLEVQAGGPENLSCLSKDCRNFIERKRRLRLGDGDAEAIRKLLSNILWVHPRSRAAYEEFNDVVSFDTTYLVNRYKLPFATIVGVNHHGQSILLGCALISHEDVNTFKWLFMTWLEAMEDVHPNSILTDKCESMRKAIREVMPNTRHRFYLWHILCKVPEKFKGVSDYDSACLEFKAVIYDSLTIEMFERNWNEFVVKHGLERNEWLSKLYVDREYWVLIYLNHTFWAGMVSTQRSESMHAYFDGYVNSMSTLKQFVEQYEIAMCDKNEKEFYADFKSKNTVVNCISVFEWEQQFQKAFTNLIFKLVQEEIKRMWYCHVIQPTEEGRREADNEPGIERHKIMEKSIINNWFRREFVYDVEYRENGQYFSCNCKKFESKGILCCHIMRLMSLKDIKFINERYLLRRWRKDVNRVHSKKFFHGGYPHMTEEFEKYREMERLFQEASDLAYDDNKIKFVKQRLAELKRDLLSWNDGMIAPTSNAQVIIDTNNADENEENERVILNPHVTRSRGRPRINRHKSVREITQRENSGRNRNSGRGRRRGRPRNNINSNIAEQVGPHNSQTPAAKHKEMLLML